MTNSKKQDKNLPQNNQTQQNKNNTTDSSKVCHSELTVNVAFSGSRKHTSFRCDSNLWKTFKSVCKNNGLSTCDILEKLILGFCVGYTTRVAQPTTIDVVVDAPRVVKRVRRRQLVFEDEVEEEGGGCGVCGAPAEFLVSYVLKPPGWGFGTVTFNERDVLKGRFCRVHYEKLCRDNLSVVLSCKPLSERES